MGGLYYGFWALVDSQLHFSVESNGLLFKSLLEHMDSEFPAFSQKLQELKGCAVPLVEARYATRAENDPDAGVLRANLALVIERRTFKGSCDICRDFIKALDGEKGDVEEGGIPSNIPL